jgi:hypothetical protein
LFLAKTVTGKNCGEAQASYCERRDYAVLYAVVPVFFFKKLKSKSAE